MYIFTVPPLYFRRSPCSFKPDTDVRETEQKRDLWMPQISSLTGVQGCAPVNSLFSKGTVFPLPARIAVSGKTSGKELLLFLFLAFLADCCILFTITSKKTKCSTALASKLRLSDPLHHTAPIFLPLLFCSRGVFPLGRFKNLRCIICAAKRISASIAVRERG